VIAINKVDTSWAPSAGEDRYRRGLYTHWRRTAPFAAFATFDAPSRECCTVQRPRTNTPLQALTGLNDPGFFDAAKGLAGRIMGRGGDVRAGIEYAFRCCVSRRPEAGEVDLLADLFAKERERLRRDPKAAKALAKSWNAEREEALADWGAWTMVSNVLLNLDETITKE
jgi:hypothetical protein